jgi:hypothetical protein
MESVSSVTMGSYTHYGSTLSHSTAYKVVDWNTSNICAACNDTAGRKAALCGWFPTTQWYAGASGDWVRMFRNMLIWAGRADDVGVTKIDAPPSLMDSGATVTPACSTFNYGNQPETYKVMMRIGSAYLDSATVTGHAPFTYVYATFPSWTPTARGNQAVACSTRLNIDQRQSNDKVTLTSFVRVKDVASVLLNTPTPGGAYGAGTIIVPKATWRNYGNVTAAFQAWMCLDNAADSRVYARSLTIASLAPGASIFVTAFPPCTLSTGGIWTAKCSTGYAGDLKVVNDTLIRTFTVGNVDVGVTAINAPTGGIDSGAVVVPRGTARNFGDSPTSFNVIFKIDSAGTVIYNNTKPVVALGVGASITVTFDTWPKPHALGPYTTRCSAYVAGDGNHSNDAWGGSFTISAAPPPPPGWNAKKFMPDAPGGKQMKDGAWLAYDGSTEFIYGAKGNKVGDFYAYDPAGDSWKALGLMPPGIEAKPPYKGAAGCADGNGVVYATKGNNTQGFFSYRAATDSWKQLANVPLGLSNKKVKGGTDLQYVMRGDTGFVYLLKGYKNEFYRYNTAKDTWQSLPDAPGTLNVKWNVGSWLAYDGTGKLYGHQAKYHGHYAFDVATGTWGPALKGMPYLSRSGKSKKSNAGGCGVFGPGGTDIYALKGGNTQEFWHYFVTGDSWHELDTIPAMAPGSTKKKKVKAGGDITNADGVLYATKGNKSNEMWSYDLTPAFLAPRADRNGVMTKTTLDIRSAEFALTPNPLSIGFATLRWDMTQFGSENWDRVPIRVSIFDVTGRQVLLKSIVAGRSGATSLDLRSLSAGVYLVKLTSRDVSSSQKLVVQR